MSTLSHSLRRLAADRSFAALVSTHHPLTFASVPAILVGVALAAALAPALRAAALDPVQMLKR
jgi:ABC-type lipoprotein release transport system permease subunit